MCLSDGQNRKSNRTPTPHNYCGGCGVLGVVGYEEEVDEEDPVVVLERLSSSSSSSSTAKSSMDTKLKTSSMTEINDCALISS